MSHPFFPKGIIMFSIIDGNAIGYAAQSSRVLSVDGMQTQAIFNSLKTARSLRKTFTDYPKFLWLWDGRAQFRFDLYPDYKGNRTDTPEKREMKEQYGKQKPYLEEMLTCLGVTQVIAPNYEADDLAGYFVRRAEAKNFKTRLITGDGDWLQLISTLTDWHDPRRDPGKFCNRNDFREVTGFDSTGQFLQAKALQGDTSDNITGVGGLGEKAALLIMEHYGDVRNLIKKYREHGEFTKENLPKDLSRYRKKLNDFCQQNAALFVRNYRLMNLCDATRDEDIRANIQQIKGKKDMDRFEQLCKEFRFMSILRELDSWGELF